MARKMPDLISVAFKASRVLTNYIALQNYAWNPSVVLT